MTVPSHHVSAAWLAGCVLVVLRVSGVLGREAFRTRIDWAMVMFLLGVDGIVRIIGYLGLDDAIAHLAAVRDAASAIRPRAALRIAAIAVASGTGRAERMQVERFEWSPLRSSRAGP